MGMDKEKYVTLLEAIKENAISIKDVAVLILEESLKKQKTEEKMTLVAFSENFLFAFLDEIGKFYLIKKQYPQNIDILDLKAIGFYLHNKKLEAINEIVRERQKIRGSLPKFKAEEGIKILRKFKDTTLHIDYKNGEIIKPYHSTTLNRKVFKNYIDLVNILSVMVQADLNDFKLSQ